MNATPKRKPAPKAPENRLTATAAPGGGACPDDVKEWLDQLRGSIDLGGMNTDEYIAMMRGRD